MLVLLLGPRSKKSHRSANIRFKLARGIACLLRREGSQVAGPMQVLIADDLRDSAESLALLCEAWGFQPRVAFDGKQAFEALHEPGSPMLCLLDWQMPRMNGIELCTAIRQKQEVPYRYLILITGRGDRSQMVAGLEAGADDFLLKPVHVEELRARLMTGSRVLNLQAQLLLTMKQLREQATRDGLTHVWNRTTIFEILQREMTRGFRQESPLSAILLDIDHFKHINDRHGHLTGDMVLRTVASRLIGGLRPYDSVGRYGGEEFLVVLPGCDTVEAMSLAERLRTGIAQHPFDSPDGPLSVTASFGVVTWNGCWPILDLVRRADQSLYNAKNQGRNRVIGSLDV